MLNVADAIVNATQTYEDPDADALFKRLVDSGIPADRAHKAIQTVMPGKTGRSFNPAREPGKPAHGQGPAQTAPVPGEAKPVETAGGLADPQRDLMDAAERFYKSKQKKDDFDRALAGSAVSPVRTQQAFNSARNITGKGIPATPVNGEAAVQKYLRMGGGMPTAAQLAATGRISEDDFEKNNRVAIAAAQQLLKQERDDKYAAIKAREAGKRRSTETAIFE